MTYKSFIDLRDLTIQNQVHGIIAELIGPKTWDLEWEIWFKRIENCFTEADKFTWDHVMPILEGEERAKLIQARLEDQMQPTGVDDE